MARKSRSARGNCAGRRRAAFGRRNYSGRLPTARSARTVCQRSGADRRNFSGRENCLAHDPRQSGSRTGQAAFSWARTSSAEAAKRSSCAPAETDGIRQSYREAEAASAGNRIRTRHPSFRLFCWREITFLLVLAIFAFNVYFHKPVLDSFLFALALAVGLTPQLLAGDHQHQSLPRCATHGAEESDREAARRDRELRQHERALLRQNRHDHRRRSARSPPRSTREGNASAKVLLCAYLNAANETGFVNPIDEAIRACAAPDAPVGESWTRSLTILCANA